MELWQNCRKMEDNVERSGSAEKDSDKYVLISLYVDDKEQLPEKNNMFLQLQVKKKLLVINGGFGKRMFTKQICNLIMFY